MNDNDDAAYYLSRAEQEDAAARKAVNPLAATIHRSLADRYRVRATDCMAADLKATGFEDCQQLSIVRD